MIKETSPSGGGEKNYDTLEKEAKQVSDVTGERENTPLRDFKWCVLDVERRKDNDRDRPKWSVNSELQGECLQKDPEHQCTLSQLLVLDSQV